MKIFERLFGREGKLKIQVMPAPARRDSGPDEKSIVMAESQYKLPIQERTQWEAIVNKNVALLQQFADAAAREKESHAGEWSILKKDQRTSAYFPRSSDSIQIKFNPSIGEITGITFSNLPPQKALAGQMESEIFTRGVFDTRFAIAYVEEFGHGEPYKMISMENIGLVQADPDAIAVLGRSLENFRIQQNVNQ